MLGACAFGFRNLSRTKTLQAIATVGPRLMLALFGGFVGGLFTDFIKGLTLPPLAIAFLVGYSVEIFFSFLDRIIETAKAPTAPAHTT
jgi:hypothetical protein